MFSVLELTSCTTMLTYILVIALCVSDVISDGLHKCPDGCYCDKRFVDCSALMEFPTYLPEDTTRFRSTLMNVQQIPPKAFSYLKHIETIELTQGNIGTVDSCAFTDLPSVKRIIFEKAVIGNVEMYAFTDLKNLVELKFVNSKIGRLKPFGFYGLDNITTFSVVSTPIRFFYTHGFSNVSNITNFMFNQNNISDMVTNAFVNVKNIAYSEILENTFWNMHCGNLATLSSMGTETHFTQNAFHCNCSINYILNVNGRSTYSAILPTNKCNGPGVLEDKQSLWHVTYDDLGCSNRDQSKNVICPDVKLTPDQKCDVIPSTPRTPGSAVPVYPEPEEHDEPRGDASTCRAFTGLLSIAVALSYLLL